MLYAEELQQIHNRSEGQPFDPIVKFSPSIDGVCRGIKQQRSRLLTLCILGLVDLQVQLLWKRCQLLFCMLVFLRAVLTSPVWVSLPVHQSKARSSLFSRHTPWAAVGLRASKSLHVLYFYSWFCGWMTLGSSVLFWSFRSKRMSHGV